MRCLNHETVDVTDLFGSSEKPLEDFGVLRGDALSAGCFWPACAPLEFQPVL